jgi:5-methylcytosine-specific restriction endonuclease McrA
MICLFDGCEKKLNSNNTSGYCREHYHGSPVHKDRKNSKRREIYVPKPRTSGTCVVCGKELSNGNKSGFCFEHNDLRPERKQRQLVSNMTEEQIEMKRERGRRNYDREKAAFKWAKHRAKDNWIEDVDRQIVLERDEGICHICSDPVDPNEWHLDHVVPLSKGGTHEYANVAVSHPFCNESKGDKLLEELDLEDLISRRPFIFSEIFI